MTTDGSPQQQERHRSHWPGALVWLLAWAAMLLLDGRLELANLALLLVLAAALAALWLPLAPSMVSCAAAVTAFNYSFVPPRGSLSIDLHQHTLLLLTMLAVSWIVSGLMTRQRQQAAGERMHARRAEQLQRLGDALRDSDDPLTLAPHLRQLLEGLGAGPAQLLLLKGPVPPCDDAQACIEAGEIDADERAGLWLCLRQRLAMGPGTGQHEEQPAWYLPMRGRKAAFGAALVGAAPLTDRSFALREHAQALCDQMGLALERAAAWRAAAAAHDEAQAQQLRNTLLTAISHDYRTPLATILSAASSLHDQDARLSVEQRRRLAATIIDEAGQLARLSDNTLQLARLDAPSAALQLDWESVEEIIGTVLRRVRLRNPSHRVVARIEQDLPLLRCDAVLLVQLLENLVDNALKYGGTQAPVELRAQCTGERLVLAVRDRGPGVPVAWRERIFEVFQRADAAASPDRQILERRGAGVGLAVCRAIARAHGGELRLRPRGHGGSSFECSLPVFPAPDLPALSGENENTAP